MENFAISGVKLFLYPDLIKGLAMVKMAAARANHDCDAKSMPRAVLRGIPGWIPGGHPVPSPS